MFYYKVCTINHLFTSRQRCLWVNTYHFALAVLMIRSRAHIPVVCWFASPGALMFYVERQHLSPTGKLPCCCSVESQENQIHLLTLPIVWPCRLLSVACHNRQATCVPRACLGFGSPVPCTCLLMHELCMFESKQLTGKEGKGGGKSGAFHYSAQRSQGPMVLWRQGKHWQSPPAYYKIGSFGRCGQLTRAQQLINCLRKERHQIFLFAFILSSDLR